MTSLPGLVSLRNWFIIMTHDFIYVQCMYSAHTFKMIFYVIAIHMYMYYFERCVNISITRITRVNNICFCYVAISDGTSTHADFQVDGYHGC